jgi:hypothetical protein
LLKSIDENKNTEANEDTDTDTDTNTDTDTDTDTDTKSSSSSSISISRRKSVQFRSSARIKKIPRLYVTLEEKSDLWYSHKEIRKMRTENNTSSSFFIDVKRMIMVKIHRRKMLKEIKA